MKKEEEEEPTEKKQENLGEKLRKVGGKRGGLSTPVLPFPDHGGAQFSSGGAQDSDLVAEENNPSLSSTVPVVSARKLAATVWELQHYKLPLVKMHHGGGGGGRRNHRNHQLHHYHRHHLQDDNSDPSPASPDLGSASSLRRHVAASLMQHHRTIQRDHHAIQPVSPASYGSSSMEVARYNPAVTPTSSIEIKGAMGETSYNLKTSTELLKVLNRIWSLEEQHTTNVSLVRALKRELDLSRAKVKELVRDRQSDRHEIDRLMKQIDQKSQSQVNAAVQSVREELEDEKKLRKRSETLHRKLARELYDTKTSLANALKELENERKSRKLLEDLCDEFAWGIKNYEQEMHSLKNLNLNPEKDIGSNYRANRDGLVLHISESWLDERMQTKHEMMPSNISVVEKLGSEIEAFLEAKRNCKLKTGPVSGSGARLASRRRHSLESIPLNLAASAPPRDEGDDDEISSEGSDSHCFELGKGNIINSTTSPKHEKKKLASQETGSLQVKFEEQMAQAILGQEKPKTNGGEEYQAEITEGEGDFGKASKSNESRKGSNSKYMESLIRNHYLQTGNDDSVGKSVWKSHPSPIREWTTKLPTEDLEISESSSKVPPPPESKEQNSLKSKLLEARTRGQRSRSRLKSNK